MGPKLQKNNNNKHAATMANHQYQNRNLFKNLNVIYDEKRNREEGYWSSSSSTSSDEDESANIHKMKRKEMKNKSVEPTTIVVSAQKEESYEEYTKRMAKEEWLWATGQLGISPEPSKYQSSKQKETQSTHTAVGVTDTRNTSSSPTTMSDLSQKTALIHKDKLLAVANHNSQVNRPSTLRATDEHQSQLTNYVINEELMDNNNNNNNSTYLTSLKDNVSQDANADVIGDAHLSPQTYRSTNKEFLKLLNLLVPADSINERESRPSNLSDESDNDNEEKKKKEIKEETTKKECHIKDDKEDNKTLSSDVTPDISIITPCATNSYCSLEKLEQLEFDRLKDEWLEQDSKELFIAEDIWQKAKKMAADKFFDLQQRCNSNTAYAPSLPNDNSENPKDIMSTGEGKDNTNEDIMNVSEFYAMHKQQNRKLDEERAADERFSVAVEALESLVVSRPFVDKVQLFLHDNHAAMIATKPCREKGEYSHEDYATYQRYVSEMEELVIGTLRSAVGKECFDEEEFFDKLFEPTKTTSLDDEEHDDPLSFEAWESLLSILKFECFLDLMDDYIAAVYGFDDISISEGGLGAPKAASKRGLPARRSGGLSLSEVSHDSDITSKTTNTNASVFTTASLSPSASSVKGDSLPHAWEEDTHVVKSKIGNTSEEKEYNRLPSSAGATIGRPQKPSMECRSKVPSSPGLGGGHGRKGGSSHGRKL